MRYPTPFHLGLWTEDGNMVISMTQIPTVGWSRRSILDPVRCQVAGGWDAHGHSHRSICWPGMLIKTSVKHAQFVEGR